MQRLFIARECSVQNRFVNEVHSELERVIAGDVAQVVAELIFLLVAQRRKSRDRRGELVIAIGLEAGDCKRCGTKRKCKSEAERGVPPLSEVQQTRVEHERAEPG